MSQNSNRHQISRLENQTRALAAARSRVNRLEDEVKLAKDNLKLAKDEFSALLRDTCELALDEAAGMQTLFPMAASS